MASRRSIAVAAGGGLIAVAVAVAGWAFTRQQGPAFRGYAVADPYPAPDFTLTDQEQRPFRLSSQRGKAVLMYFGYTLCPDACPATLLRFQAVRQALGADADRVAFLMISVDPERDTPARMKAFLANFDPAIVGLTGAPQAVQEVLKLYHVVAEKVSVAGSATGYLVDHTATVYLVDPAGRVRVMFPFGAGVDDYVHDVRLVLGERGSGAR